MKQQILNQIEEIYASGEVNVKEFQKIRDKFTFLCNFCKSDNIAIITETDDDGYCDSCSSPYARATIKCRDCGQGISIR